MKKVLLITALSLFFINCNERNRNLPNTSPTETATDDNILKQHLEKEAEKYISMSNTAVLNQDFATAITCTYAASNLYLQAGNAKRYKETREHAKKLENKISY